MGYAFISYSRDDQAYVDSLIEYLDGLGLETWIDRDSIRVGWVVRQAIQRAIDGCDAFVLVMTPESRSSKWVGDEVDWAERQGKPILPLLLSGDLWFGIARALHEDVTGGKMPSASFLSVLKDHLSKPISSAALPDGHQQSQYLVIGQRELSASASQIIRQVEVEASVFLITRSRRVFATLLPVSIHSAASQSWDIAHALRRPEHPEERAGNYAARLQSAGNSDGPAKPLSDGEMIVGVKQFSQRTSELLSSTEGGRSLLITRRNKVVALLVPLTLPDLLNVGPERSKSLSAVFDTSRAEESVTYDAASFGAPIAEERTNPEG